MPERQETLCAMYTLPFPSHPMHRNEPARRAVAYLRIDCGQYPIDHQLIPDVYGAIPDTKRSALVAFRRRRLTDAVVDARNMTPQYDAHRLAVRQQMSAGVMASGVAEMIQNLEMQWRS